ncbi:MAG: serine/threonine protein kinase, partial [Pirellulaceae bacterium]|nr:serine/threonine protein kinase [Pirellulaceae bacterium]
MQKPAATIGIDDERLKETTATPHLPRTGGDNMKFAYASGTRPLDGFTIKRGVGIGGFGEVYFATSDAGKEVALKRIQRNLDVELRGVRQCLNLKHLNLISLYDIRYDDEGGAWVVMEFVAGESLKDVIERNPNGMPTDEVDAWFRGIAAGVAYLHDHGIVHRDLKPGNIFDDGGVVKIGDYGLSKFISCSRRSGQTESVGTFHYMAPEIGKGVYGKEIDVYALGIILFEMLTGRVPFEGESSQEIIMKHLTADPDLTGVPDRYRPAIERSLRKDPDQRFADVESLVRCFELGEPLEPDPIVEVLAEEVHVATAQPVPAAPPVVRPASAASDQQGTLYISDEEPAAEIVFGPVQQRAGKLPPRTLQPPGPVQPPQPPRTSLQSTPAVAQEPVAQAVRQGVQSGARWWRDARLSTPLKVLVAFGAVFVVLLNANWLLPLAVFAGAVYLVYFGVRSLIMALNGTSPAGAVAGAAAAGMTAANVATRPAARGQA